jgi:hypothetical protein
VNQNTNNLITMIGCNRAEFTDIIKKAVGEISMSSGSYYAPYSIYDNNGLLAKYESNGTLIYNRQ